MLLVYYFKGSSEDISWCKVSVSIYLPLPSRIVFNLNSTLFLTPINFMTEKS